MIRSLLFAVVAWSLFPAWAVAETAESADPFASVVRSSEPLSAEEEAPRLAVPPGFRLDLVASEPAIHKPLNMAFDARGRLWLSDTVEYPYAVKGGGVGRDSIKILDDRDGDGRAESVVTFADGLNIPIGVLPHGNGAIVFSIPYIWRLEDTDGDDRCDRRTVLYGPFSHDRDTHGLNNAFRRGFDGWVYACHGFSNRSLVAGTDGHQVELNSGTIYRFRVDGSRIETFTKGQVNPFGMAITARDDVLTADCHTKPIYALLRGGCYPSFQGAHDGLGFAPAVMRHLHGSTAIAGIACYEDDRFPADYRGDVFTGNVMTGRVHRDALAEHGSTYEAVERDDLVVSSDPWFRPVDLQVGPDGAVYVADFYNRVIGHYEVALDHPGRDRERGRVWRVSHEGVSQDRPAARLDLAGASFAELLKELDSANSARRLMATHALADDHGAYSLGELQHAFDASSSAWRRVGLLWALARRGELDESRHTIAAQDSDPLLRLHAMRVLGEAAEWTENGRALALDGLSDSNPFVVRAAVDACGRHPSFDQVSRLLSLARRVPEADTFLAHTVKMAFRDHLANAGIMRRIMKRQWTADDRSRLARAALGTHGRSSAELVMSHLVASEPSRDELIEFSAHVAWHADAETCQRLVELVRTRLDGDWMNQAKVLLAIVDGSASRGEDLAAFVRAWGMSVAECLLPPCEGEAWSSVDLSGARSGADWGVESRSCEGLAAPLPLYSSRTRGEAYQGILRSPTFTLTARLSFRLAGHDRVVDGQGAKESCARLVLDDGEEAVRVAWPPANDRAASVEWDVSEFAGRRGHVELVDGNSGAAYAWLAAGGFSEDALNPVVSDEERGAALQLVDKLDLREPRPRLVEWLSWRQGDPAARCELLRALGGLDGDARLASLAECLGGEGEPLRKLTAELALELKAGPLDPNSTILASAVRVAPARDLSRMANVLSSDADGAKALVELARRGYISPRALLAANVANNLRARRDERLSAEVDSLVRDLPSLDATLEKLLAERREKHAATPRDAVAGGAVFTKHCRACHQLAGEGALVGPQLDGIGHRGLDRLMEDVLDPNRAVDAAFRASTFALTDGRIITALVQRDDGDGVTLVDQAGREVTLRAADIDERAQGTLSLMPSNVADTLTETEFFDLMAFLLNQRR